MGRLQEHFLLQSALEKTTTVWIKKYSQRRFKPNFLSTRQLKMTQEHVTNAKTCVLLGVILELG